MKVYGFVYCRQVVRSRLLFILVQAKLVSFKLKCHLEYFPEIMEIPLWSVSIKIYWRCIVRQEIINAVKALVVLFFITLPEPGGIIYAFITQTGSIRPQLSPLAEILVLD